MERTRSCHPKGLVTNDLEKITRKLLKTSKSIKTHQWKTFGELRNLLILESQLMIQLVMVLGYDLSIRNPFFVRRN